MKTAKLLLPILVTASLACGKQDQPSKTQPAAPAAATPKSAPKASAPAAPTPAAKPKELPAPPPEAFGTGKARVVHLYVAPSGETPKVDIVALRSFKYGPTRLVEGLELGKASAWFSAPKGMSLVIVPSGAEPDRKNAIASLYNPSDGKHDTTILARDSSGKASASVPGGVPASGPEGKALVVVFAHQLMGFEKELTASPLGGRNFEVGDGAGNCLSKTVLGGTNYVPLVVDPGHVKVTLHKWPGDCSTPALYELEIDAAADKPLAVFLYTKDGTSLENLQIPLNE